VDWDGLREKRHRDFWILGFPDQPKKEVPEIRKSRNPGVVSPVIPRIQKSGCLFSRTTPRVISGLGGLLDKGHRDF
jgi:hypothetical protein